MHSSNGRKRCFLIQDHDAIRRNNGGERSDVIVTLSSPMIAGFVKNFSRGSTLTSPQWLIRVGEHET
jgi:hypothetical protein